MLSPSYSITATERVLPRLAIDFTTAVLDQRITFARSGSTATVINSSGVISAVNADTPRFEYNPATLACKGLLIEETRTNLLLNSLIDGTNLSTQTVTVTAAAHTLSFYGTGQIVLTGAHSATVTGTGAYPTRTTLVFTPTSGSLTLTVTGSVQFAQLELGGFATSFIPTAGSAVTRNADVATMTGANFSDWFNASEGTFAAWGSAAQVGPFISADDGTTGKRIQTRHNGTSSGQLTVVDTTVQANIASAASSFPLNTIGKVVAGYKTNNFGVAANASAVVVDTAGTIPTVNSATIGNGVGSNYICGVVAKILYWPQKLSSSEIQAFSK